MTHDEIKKKAHEFVEILLADKTLSRETSALLSGPDPAQHLAALVNRLLPSGPQITVAEIPDFEDAMYEEYRRNKQRMALPSIIASPEIFPGRT